MNTVSCIVVVLTGVIPWGCKVQDIIDKGRKAVQVVTSSQRNPLASMLLRGLPGCGKTALAAYIAKSSEFPFVKVISPENMVGFTESAKCAAIKKVFDDAYKSELSCIVVDNIERLLGKSHDHHMIIIKSILIFQIMYQLDQDFLI